MSRRYYHLPPLTTLAAFETSARHLSFKNAAQELSVTPGAVSHQIKALEGELGVQLFRRKHRGVELTEEGESLFDSLASSFAKISQCLKSLQERGSGNRVTIGSTSAVASLWLSPSVVRFWRNYPDVDVNQSIQDEQSLNAPEIDLYIRYGRSSDTRLMQTELFRDHLIPVGSPGMAARLNGCALADLARERLIHLESSNKNWTTWHDWFLRMGHDAPVSSGVRVNNYAVALQVAQEGAGLALGWQRLIRPLLATGQLVPIIPHAISAPNRFYLVGRPDEELSEAALRLKSWIIQELGAQTDELN
ncbi:LysR substrate-binding domain-containing protein [Paracoccus saliphilus]|uniref:LysR family transcriptional regulator n=1 Tax=Paracoccus saliphilus TaxID=405559 RepID=A0AA46A4Q0_9RHOB|nr:LysR substrate-binding domain-containing protein [Paracoccus saliphilus]WCR01992.1 LysR family transcriptional regulator [Paracoccus saliphilus]SIS66185.1 transcriptional regulator, LysR family [Paracoccus saliphilus]